MFVDSVAAFAAFLPHRGKEALTNVGSGVWKKVHHTVTGIKRRTSEIRRARCAAEI
jgi:hypothetical protein